VCGATRTEHEYPSTSPTVIVPNPTITPGEIHSSTADYVSHHNGFMFYTSTSNPHHLPPTSVAAIGTAADQANHEYDTKNFFQALANGNVPAVSFIKAPAAYNGHPGNSDPTTEQYWLTQVINQVMLSPIWGNTAIIIAYDDSDGWYDHQPATVSGTPFIGNGSFTSVDSLSGTNACGISGTTPQLPGPFSGGAPVQGRCGPGVRTPMLVISPWAKPNFVDHTLTTQTSVVLFIEQNWNLGFIGGGSFDAIANPINNMFNFSQGTPQNATPLILSTTTGLPQN